MTFARQIERTTTGCLDIKDYMHYNGLLTRITRSYYKDYKELKDYMDSCKGWKSKWPKAITEHVIAMYSSMAGYVEAAFALSAA